MTDLHSRPAADPAELSAGPARTIVTPKPRPRRLVRRTLKHVVMVAASLAMIYPLLWMVVSSLRPNDEIFRNPSLWKISSLGRSEETTIHSSGYIKIGRAHV